jgi:xylulokinase
MSFEIRRCVEVLGDAPMAPVRITGWMAENPVDLQILADILDRPVHAYKLPSASAMGAALLTGFADQKAYFSEITPSVFSPITKNTRCYDELFASYIAQFPARSADAASPTKESSRRAL